MVTAIEYIEQSADACGGKPRIVGTRIRVQDIAVLHDRLGMSADEIVSNYKQLTLSAVYSALAFYHEHREEIDADIVRGKQLADDLRQKFPSKLTRPKPAS
jgi:uncharacterized protein (DUF433 family)